MSESQYAKGNHLMLTKNIFVSQNSNDPIWIHMSNVIRKKRYWVLTSLSAKIISMCNMDPMSEFP
jgi:hypothetical protein